MIIATERTSLGLFLHASVRLQELQPSFTYLNVHDRCNFLYEVFSCIFLYSCFLAVQFQLFHRSNDVNFPTVETLKFFFFLFFLLLLPLPLLFLLFLLLTIDCKDTHTNTLAHTDALIKTKLCAPGQTLILFRAPKHG